MSIEFTDRLDYIEVEIDHSAFHITFHLEHDELKGFFEEVEKFKKEAIEMGWV